MGASAPSRPMPLPMCSAGCGTGSSSPSRRGLHGGSRPAKTPTVLRARPGLLGVVDRVLSGCGWSRGRWVVQICCKGRCGVRVAEMKPHDSAVLSAVRGVCGRLCNRFGHRARVRCPIRDRCRLAGRALSRGSPVAGSRARGSIPGLARRAGLHKQGSRAPSRVPVANPSDESTGVRRGAACRSQWRPRESRRAGAPRELLPR